MGKEKKNTDFLDIVLILAVLALISIVIYILGRGLANKEIAIAEKEGSQAQLEIERAQSIDDCELSAVNHFGQEILTQKDIENFKNLGITLADSGVFLIACIEHLKTKGIIPPDENSITVIERRLKWHTSK